MKLNRTLVLLVLIPFLSACSFSLAEDITPPPGAQMPVSQTQPAQVSGPLYPSVPPDPANGQAIFAEKCAPCHGDTGQGDGPQAAQLPNPPAALGSKDLSRQSAPARWYTVVTQGDMNNFMPPFSSLSDQQRWDVVAYAFTLSAPSSEIAQGKELFQSNCTSCHGDQGRGDGPQAAGLSVPPPDLTNQSFMAQKTGEDFFQAITNGVSPDMPGYADQLSDDQRWAIAEYVRSLTFAGPGQPVASAATPEPGATPPPQGTPVESTSPLTSTQTVSTTEMIGTVTGKVNNASGGELPSDLEITLHGFDDMNMVITDTTTTQADGSFVFQNIDMPVGRVFMATVDYQDTTYGSDIGMVSAGDNKIDLPIPIYETTTDASILSVDRLHLFFDFVDSQTLRVIELYVISNPTDKTLVAAGNGKTTINFKLPQGASNLEFQDGALGGRYIQTSDGFGDTVAVRPGSGNYQVLFAFEMPYDKKLDLVQPISLPVSAVVILVPESGLKIKSDMLTDAGNQDVQGTSYHMYNGGSLSPGDNLSISISGGPASGSLALVGGSTNNIVIGLGAFGLALIIAGVWLFRRTRANAGEEYYEDEDDFNEADGDKDENIDTLMDAILALDDLYQAGELPEEAYRQRRSELKARLQELMD